MRTTWNNDAKYLDVISYVILHTHTTFSRSPLLAFISTLKEWKTIDSVGDRVREATRAMRMALRIYKRIR